MSYEFKYCGYCEEPHFANNACPECLVALAFERPQGPSDKPCTSADDLIEMLKFEIKEGD